MKNFQFTTISKTLFTHSFILYCLLASVISYGQSWQDCNEMILTVDDFGTTLDFENQPADCGCNSQGECTLVRIRLVETINGVETPVSTTGIGFMPPLGNDSEPNQISKDYIDLFDPYFNQINCTEYQANGGLNHNYLISPVAPPGQEFHVLVCPGSEAGVRNGRFFLPPGDPSPTIAAPTNVNATDGAVQTDVSFGTIPGKYYMAFRNSENCNDAWVKIDGNSNWPQATTTTMTIRDQQGSTYGNEYEYRVVASDFAFNPATTAAGIWSDGDLGHGGALLQAYDADNSCTSSGNDCTNDMEPPACNGNNFTVGLDPGQNYYTFNINDFASDECSPMLTYENASLDPSTPNGTTTHFWGGMEDQFPCGTYIITDSWPFDDAGNFNNCSFTFTIECDVDCCGNEKIIGSINEEGGGIIKEVDGIRLLLSTTTIGSSTQAIVSKLDLNNDVVWSRRINEESQFLDFTINEDGNILAIGRTTPVLVGQTNQCIMGIINSNTGAIISMKKHQFFGRQTFTKILKHDIPLNPSFPYYIMGVENGSTGNSNANDDVLLLNVDDQLQVNWSKKYVKTDDNQWVRDIIGLSNGNLLLVGDQDGGLGVLVIINGITGDEMVVEESTNVRSFTGIIELSSGNFMSVGRSGLTSQNRGMICYHDSNLSIRNAIHFNGAIKSFYSITEIGPGTFVATGSMLNDRTVLIEFTIPTGTIQIQSVKYFDHEGIHSSNANVNFIGGAFLYAKSVENHPLQIGDIDILYASLSSDLSDLCLIDTTLAFVNDPFTLSSKTLNKEDLPIDLGENMSIALFDYDLNSCDTISTPPCVNTVLHFDGDDDRVIADSPLMGNSDYSISLDFKGGPQNNGSYPRLISFTSFETEIAISDTELAYYNGSTWIESNVDVADNSWHNAVLVRSNGQHLLYLDGILLSTNSGPASLNFTGSIFIGGNSSGSDEYFEGLIDNVKVWDTPLDSMDICDIANLNPKALHYDFEIGSGGEDNTGIMEIPDLIGSNNGTLNNFSLTGAVSNLLCEEYEISECPDVCDLDTTPPLVSCPVNSSSININSDGTFSPSMSSFNVTADDDCKMTFSFSPEVFTCDDLGDNLVVLTVTDEAGNTSGCNINFVLNDPSNHCGINSCNNNTVMHFDGVNDKIVTPSPLSGNADYTISLNFKCLAQSNGAYARLIGFSSFETEIAIKGTELAYYNGSSWRDSGINVADDFCHNVTLVRGNNENALYLDGILISVLAAPTNLAFGGNLNIGGKDSGSNEFYGGTIDNVKIWNTALDSSQLCELNTLDPNVLYYDFEEGNGDNDNSGIAGPVDLSSSGNNGTFTGFTLNSLSSNYICEEVCNALKPCVEIPQQCDEMCMTDEVDLSTGVNFDDGTLFPIGQYDGGWVMVSGPDMSLNYPQPGFVLNPNSSWSNQLNAQYISPFANTSNNNSFPEPYTFERQFCICEWTTVHLDIAALFDNFIEVGLYDESGVLIEQLINVQTNSTDNFTVPTTSNTTHLLSPGIYSLRAGLRNDAQESMGMAIEATLTGAGLISSGCCSPYQYITGTVFEDTACDAVYNTNSDPVFADIIVSLCDQSGMVLQQSTTDAFGFYTFFDVDPGEYIIKQDAINGLVLTLGDGGYQINIQPNTVTSNIDFGNCSDPCNTDSTPPTCIVQDINISLDEFGNTSVSVDQINNGSFDDCGIQTSFLEGQVDFDCQDVGVNEVVLVVVDNSGNSSTCISSVMVEDKFAPSCNTQDITVELSSDGEVTISAIDIDAGSSDNCSFELSIDQETFTCSDLGEQLVTLTVSDGTNEASCTGIVTVLANEGICDPTCIFSCTPECSTGLVDLSTGIDSATGTFLSVGDYDANWTLISSPDPGIQVPRPAFVLNPNTAWDDLPGSKYISAYPDADNNASNIADGTFYEFEKCFCVCEDTNEVNIKLEAYVDNNLEILLFDSNGTEIQSLLNITDTTAGAFTAPPEDSETTLNLENGIYCLRARLKNDAAFSMGMSIQAEITGIGLIENQCCKTYNAITGVVFNDVACDAINTTGVDSGISNWDIQLCASDGTVIETLATDSFGYFSFNNIAPGEYIAKALNPNVNINSTDIEFPVTIDLNEVISVDFGFCDIGTSVDEADNIDNFISINPIPFSKSLIIDFSSEEHNGFDCQIINSVGQVLQSFEVERKLNKYDLEVYDIPSGIYYVKFIDKLNHSQFTKRILKF